MNTTQHRQRVRRSLLPPADEDKNRQMLAHHTPPHLLVQRVQTDPSTLTATDLLYLQRTIGNWALVQGLSLHKPNSANLNEPEGKTGAGTQTVGTVEDPMVMVRETDFGDDGGIVGGTVQRAMPSVNGIMQTTTLGRTPSIQRAGDEKEIKKRNRKIRWLKAKKGLSRVGGLGTKTLEMLVHAPLHLIEEASVLDLHAKDLVNYVRSGKTRDQRWDSSEDVHMGADMHKKSSGDWKRKIGGRVGLRTYLAGAHYHNMFRTAKNLDLPWQGKFNPFGALLKGPKSAAKSRKKSDKKIEKLRHEKEALRNPERFKRSNFIPRRYSVRGPGTDIEPESAMEDNRSDLLMPDPLEDESESEESLILDLAELGLDEDGQPT